MGLNRRRASKILPNERGPEIRRTLLRPNAKARAKALRDYNRRLARAAKLRERAVSQGQQTQQTPLVELLRAFTFRDLSRMTGIPYHTLRSYLCVYPSAPMREPSFTNGLRIARALGVHPERLWSFLVSQQRAKASRPREPQP